MNRIIRCEDTREEIVGYKNYLKSKHWMMKKKEYSKEYERVCSCCGGKENLHLHHLTYDRIGNEPLTDLVYLCKECHTKLHKIVNNTKDTSVFKELRRVRKSKKRGGTGKCCKCVHCSRGKKKEGQLCELGFDYSKETKKCPRFAPNDYRVTKEEKKKIKEANKGYKERKEASKKEYVITRELEDSKENVKNLVDSKQREFKRLMAKKKKCS